MDAMEPAFLSLDEVLEIHRQQIERYGGSNGLRDAAGLESAVATPQATFGGEFLHRSIPAMAAAYLFHLCQNHAFIDGNNRVGANAAITFLLMNNWEPLFGQEELVELVLSVASGVLGKPALIDILEVRSKNIESLKPRRGLARLREIQMEHRFRFGWLVSAASSCHVCLNLPERHFNQRWADCESSKRVHYVEAVGISRTRR